LIQSYIFAMPRFVTGNALFVGDEIDVRVSKKRLLVPKSMKHDVPRNPRSGGLAALRIKASL